MGYRSFTIGEALKRAARGWRYARNRTTPMDAETMGFEMHQISGWHPLSSVCVSDVMELALTLYECHPDLAALVRQATEFVGTEYDDNGFATGNAEEWALAKVAEWAFESGIRLVKRHD